MARRASAAIALVAVGAGAASLLAQTPAAGPTRRPSDAAEAFRLDLNAPATDGAASSPAADTPAATPTSLFNLDTPIAALIADSRAKGVLDKDLPGLSSDENLPKFRALSLRAFQPLTGGQLTVAMLEKVEADLAAIKPLARAKGRNAER